MPKPPKLAISSTMQKSCAFCRSIQEPSEDEETERRAILGEPVEYCELYEYNIRGNNVCKSFVHFKDKGN